MNTLRANDQRARNAINVLWIVLAMECIALISGYFQYDLLQTVANGGEISIEEANANDLREQVIGGIALIVFIISIVTFILWFRRAYFNLHQKVSYLSYSEGWAAGCWFVPIISLFRPYQIMKELYQETKELFEKKGIETTRYPSTNFLAIWWTLWIINNILGQFIFRYSLRAESLDELTTLTVVSIISNLIGIPLAYVTAKVIGDYAQVEPLLHELKDEINTPPAVVV